MNFFNIKHHGAVNGVTGSCHELSLSSRLGGQEGPGILIDCGLFQGAETSGKGASANQLEIDFPIEHIQALVVTHVHIDHVGRIPYLLAAGFKGPIYCSIPSAKLLPLVLEDAIKIGFTRNGALVEKFLRVIEQRLKPLPYQQWQSVIEGPDGSIAIKLQPAGHILGSAYVECEVQKRSDQSLSVASGDAQQKARQGQGSAAGDELLNKHRVVFSGDLGAPYAPLLPPPKSPYRADTLVIESTYGDRLHQGRKERRLALKAVIERAYQDRGAVLIPAFSIGRTQEILYELESLVHDLSTHKLYKDTWANLQVIVDSPLASRFTKTYRQLKPYWDEEALKRVRTGRHPLNFEQLYTVDSHDQHETAVNLVRSTAEPCIVIAASGMCAGGRIVNYLKALIEDPRTDIVFIGYQAQGTPGQTIQKYGPRGGYVELDGERYDIRAHVHSLSGYSAHADQKDLLNFARRIKHPPGQIRIIHGDDQAKRELQQKMQAILPAAEVMIPGQGESG
ncbi:MBL fold metallo-hydrolase [Aestuariicella hydrocarbonica]|uniref:MBL fold metallo-hydrolase n=1 Tax=Pseudomaricurvus hydrocarbonicus TaxID=1470433 RepID=A0A9E5MMF5_9GAMM|nr:MBL fold metallo-hydrolase [Aestuariicella hydrocarbonica]NHO66350.1 MBL fold metallo-hydrolase [Aestuariicella hydrocarbonica]